MLVPLQLISARDFNRLNTKQIDLPSKQQLQRLRIGDEVRLRTEGDFFWCRVSARDADSFLARITETVENSVIEADDTVAFETYHVYEVRPGLKPVAALPDWLLAQPATGPVYYLLRTKWPALLASARVQGHGYIAMQLIRLYDQPDDPVTDVPKLLEGGRRWLLQILYTQS